MRYQIHRLQQSSLVELGLNTEDALLLDWLLNWKDGDSMERITIEGNDIAYWVNYGKVIEELPILFKQIPINATEEEIAKCNRANTTKVARMLKGNLSKVLTRHEKKLLGKTKVYISIDRKMIDFLINNENKKATTFGEVEAKENSNSNSSICNKDNNNTSTNKNKEEKNVKELTEVEKVIKESNVNIKKTDLKECNEIFKDMDRLVKALKQMESTNSHGIKALKLAYIKAEDSKSGNYQQKVETTKFDKPKKKFLTDNSMKVDDKRIDEYEPNDFNRMVEERQTWRSQPVVETNKFK